MNIIKKLLSAIEPSTRAISGTDSLTSPLESKHRSEIKKTGQTAYIDYSSLLSASIKDKSAVYIKLIEERDVYQQLINKGKGTWNTPNYVNDETWSCWIHTLSVLNRILGSKG
ncbi:MAG: hypothetical protein IPL59_02960 [Candidatus Competibacteraceae bacterium]|uniref:Uncharacterized protein n=1 Tax=Candidatus Contendobacter odensis Run_B_J11 TaxID=1400861 RepID=A0A7U7J5L3_9GAMM|nr:hypothetical protein [Candidatus Contendobacter odensis]MBK8534149.1 hypothetical protein [Candidatus Competibacteraceae bacterium]MBK8752076.1 hypothetical protein [Candidatus Competibacteraceae bacterium]CDH46583.1 hypothetical protein BN874_530012 [Candidatus Contendobacter odensis Run_B_J11]